MLEKPKSKGIAWNLNVQVIYLCLAFHMSSFKFFCSYEPQFLFIIEFWFLIFNTKEVTSVYHDDSDNDDVFLINLFHDTALFLYLLKKLGTTHHGNHSVMLDLANAFL